MIIITRKSQKIVSKLIRWCTEEEWSHIGILIGGNVYHSDFFGVSCIPVNEFTKHNDYKAFNVRSTTQQNAVILERCKEKMGRSYDFPAIIMFFVYFLLKKMGIRFHMPMINPRWLICSEFIAYVIWGKAETITPGEVLRRLGVK
jgi:hypothetical protein